MDLQVREMDLTRSNPIWKMTTELANQTFPNTTMPIIWYCKNSMMWPEVQEWSISTVLIGH